MKDRLHLFLVEDDEASLVLMRRTLERAGHQVTTCRSAADALTVLHSTSFDLMVLDNLLPDLTGAELLQEMDRGGIAVPVLMVTGYGDEQLAAQVLRAGALDYIVKDISQKYLQDLPKRVTESYTHFRLQQTNRLLIAALESAQDGILITDVQGTMIHINKALEAMTGYGRRELLGQNPRLLRSDAHPANLFEELWQTIRAGKSWQGELTNRRKDGTTYEVSVSIAPIVDAHGRLTHFVGIHHDISGVKQLQQQLLQAQKMESVGTLAGGVAHEFNNILAGICGYASLGLSDSAAGPVRDFLQNILDLGERAAQLTRQLLTFARRAALRRAPVSIEALLEATVTLLSRTIRRELRLEMPTPQSNGDALTVEADGNQLQQAVINLALNARDAMPENGAITLGLRHGILSEPLAAYPEVIPPGDYAVLEVADTGCGMTPQVLAQALDPFFTTKEVGKGTGLGLPLVYGIVRGHNGFLDIQSRPDVGTRVGLYLPRLTPTQTPPEPAPGPVPSDARAEPGPQYHILVIDDEPAVLYVVRRFLELAGHRVTTASAAAEAFARLGRDTPAPDLIVLDWLIPREDGLTTFRRLRQLPSQAPVIILSGCLTEELTNQLHSEGAAGLLRKPFRMHELRGAVLDAIAARDA